MNRLGDISGVGQRMGVDLDYAEGNTPEVVAIVSRHFG